MNFDLGTLCILGIMLALGALLLPRLLGGLGGNPYRQRGSEIPTYDDPNIQSRGGFGGRRSYFNSRNQGNETRTYDSPNIQSRGGFGGSSQSSGTPASRKPSSGGAARTYDSPKVQSRGGFGGSKHQ